MSPSSLAVFAVMAASLGCCEGMGLSNASSQLPSGPLIVAYQDWSACNLTQTLAAVEQGVNVVVWFAIKLVKDKLTQQPVVKSGPDYECVAQVREAIESKGLPTVHLISIGGFDAPHPDPTFSGATWFATWQEWNSNLPLPFDGFDWDLEGNDNRTSVYNEFKPEVLNIVVDMSLLAKSAGLIVTAVPPQSYLDVTTGLFNTSLRNAYADWHPLFYYHGLNCYAYFLAAMYPQKFDLVTVQLYESWSRADQALIQKQISPATYLQWWTSQMLAGWIVDFGSDPALRVQGKVKIQLDQDQLIIGISFGSTNTAKSAFFWPESLADAFHSAQPALRPRGYSFWEIAMDGHAANGTERQVNFASEINSFLHTRDNMQSFASTMPVAKLQKTHRHLVRKQFTPVSSANDISM